MIGGLTLEILVQEWRRRPLRFLLTLGSVAIGTAAVFGALLASGSARVAYRQMSESLEGPPALEIVAEQGGRFQATELSELPPTDGVSSVMPLLFRTSLLRVRDRRSNVVVVGTTLERPEVARAFTLRDGQLPQDDTEILLSSILADAFQVSAGETVNLLTRRGIKKLTVAGTVERESLEPLATGAGVIMPLAAAQEAFGLRGQVDRFRVNLTSHDVRVPVKEKLASQIHSPLALQVPQGRIQMADELMRSADLALSMASTMAMAMAAFIVLNTIRMNVSERRRQLSIMRCIGATTKQVERLVLLEALFAGLGGTLIGVPLGYLIGLGLVRGIQQILQTEIPGLVPSPLTLAVPILTGPILAMVAAWFPARQTRYITPLEGLRETELEGYDAFPWRSVLSGLAMWIVGGCCITGVIVRWVSPFLAIPTAVLLLVAYILWLPALLRPLLRIAEALIRGRLQLAGQLGREQLLRRQTRTALTAGVVVVALNGSVGLGHGILNNVRDVRAWYERTFSGDFFLQPLAAVMATGPSREDPLRDALREEPGVTGVDTIRMLPGRAGDLPIICLVRDFPSQAPLPLELVGQSVPEARAALERGEAILGTILSRKLGAERGDKVLIELQGRSHPFTVGGITSDYFQGGMVVYLGLNGAQQRFDPGMPEFYSVSVAPEASNGLGDRLRELARDHQAGFFTNVEGKARFDRRINGIIGALWSVVGLIFMASGLGIANTLSVNVLEQTRELGLLRIVGMTSPQLRLLILVEAWMLGFVGIVLGLAGGLTTAYVTHLSNDPILGHSPPFAWHHELIVMSVVASLALVSLGAWGPGYRASRLDLLAAISYE